MNRKPSGIIDGKLKTIEIDKLLFSMDGKSLKETTELFNLNDAQSELISSGQRGTALMKVGSRAVKVKFDLSEERLEMFGKGGGR